MFKSHWGIDVSVVNIVCCQVEVSVTGRSLVQNSPTKRVLVHVCMDMCVSVSVTLIKCNSNPVHIH